jgi:hypothetical protein
MCYRIREIYKYFHLSRKIHNLQFTLRPLSTQSVYKYFTLHES